MDYGKVCNKKNQKIKKMIKKRIIIILVCFVSVFIKAQDNGSMILIKLSSDKSNESYFHKYEPPFKAKIIYKDTIQAVNEYPEQLMSSIISENSED